MPVALIVTVVGVLGVASSYSTSTFVKPQAALINAWIAKVPSVGVIITIVPETEAEAFVQD